MAQQHARADQFHITASCDKVTPADLGVWAAHDGGNVTADVTRIRPPGGVEESLGGLSTVEAITLRRHFNRDRDIPIKRRLRPVVGKGEVTVTIVAKDTDGNAFGTPDVYKGTLSAVNAPESDSESADASMFEIVVEAVTVG